MNRKGGGVVAEVFISYHESSAGGLAAQIADTLEASGISCWYAKRDIPTGGDFARAIPLQIDACKVFLLILNENAQTSEHIGNELALAFRRWNRKKDITIFPVKIGDFEEESWIKYYLVRAQILKCAVLDAERMQELTRRVAQSLNRELKPPVKIIKRGECGDNVTYTLDENGILIISGYGAMQDFMLDFERGFYTVPWWDNRKMISRVEIQNGVTSIGEGAFFGCLKLASISMPSSLTSIGREAICGCKGLTSISIPDGVTFIGGLAFQYCTGLTRVFIPDSVTHIGIGAFDGCTELTCVSVPAKVKIGKSAFNDSVIEICRT